MEVSYMHVYLGKDINQKTQCKYPAIVMNVIAIKETMLDFIYIYLLLFGDGSLWHTYHICSIRHVQPNKSAATFLNNNTEKLC